jgi:hypothetical protein
VSYTEAAAIRRYITGVDDFLFYEDFLNVESNEGSDERYLSLPPLGSYRVPQMQMQATAQTESFLFETTFWIPEDRQDENGVKNGASMSVLLSTPGRPHYLVRVDAYNLQLQLYSVTTAEADSLLLVDLDRVVESELPTQLLASFDIASLDCGMHSQGWNMLRVLSTPDTGEVQVFFNLMFVDFFVDAEDLPVPSGPAKTIQLAPPRIAYTPPAPAAAAATEEKNEKENKHAIAAAAASAAAGTNIVLLVGSQAARVDYVSVLPPVLLGEPFEAV